MRPTDDSLKFLALGDSYTIGESVDANGRWPNQLAKLMRARGVSIGQVRLIATTGWTTDELAAGIDAQQPAGDYDWVSLLVGVNNQYRGRSPEAFRSEFSALLERAIGLAGGESSRVFVVSIPDWGVMPFAAERDRAKIAAEIDAFNVACRDESDKRRVRFIDITPISRQAATQPVLVADDGLHPSAAQYTQWAELIDAALR